jgi:hypothetical protein
VIQLVERAVAHLFAGERQFLRSQQIGLRKSAARRRFNAERGARVRAINARVAFVDRRTGSIAAGTKGQLRALRKYLERPRDYLEDLRRSKAVALRRRRHEERSPSWLFRTIGNTLNFGIESAGLGKPQ